MDPEGNGVSLGSGAKGGPGPPSKGQDKQLICNNGGDDSHGGTRRTARQVQCDIKNPSRTDYVVL